MASFFTELGEFVFELLLFALLSPPIPIPKNFPTLPKKPVLLFKGPPGAENLPSRPDFELGELCEISVPFNSDKEVGWW